MKIVQKDWPWPHELEQRDETKYIVVHHTAGPQNQDTQRIWDEHINIGDNGIAYHRVIKGDGTTVQGRPDDTVGAHALGVNRCSVGIVLEGYFHDDREGEKPDVPTKAQLKSLKENLKDLKAKYPNAVIIGHRQVAEIYNNSDYATACPGDILYEMLPEIITSL